MKRIVIILLGITILNSCSEKNKEVENEPTLSSKTVEEQDATEIAKTMPGARWKVKKELDSAGNVIRYDSIYSWSYSNLEGDSIEVDMDRMLRSFYDQVDNNFPLSIHQRIPGMFEWDSLFYKRFMQNESFRSRWEEDFFEMQSAIERMDSLRYEFYKDFENKIP
ncbi:hypothetical protein [Aquimarina celericrescens]|uniref:Uncharacterized protein n=1 Tax=Aquimarina celericrescens TaxID=1964542 RepID=A0ABW5B1V4_9FLAO|nr:hypothetical protein [Aquimarina celericrescens]